MLGSTSFGVITEFTRVFETDTHMKPRQVTGRIGGGKKGNVEDVVECLACVTSFPRDQVSVLAGQRTDSLWGWGWGTAIPLTEGSG